MVIAIAGKKRSGKNTISEYIKQKYFFKEYAFAQPIKTISYLLFGWDSKQDDELKEVVDPYWGISRRQFWQWFGTDAMQIDLPKKYELFDSAVGRNFWVKIFNKLYEDNKNINYVISDFRFPHEQEYLDSIKAHTIKVIRGDANKVVDLHESEIYIDNMKTDFIIYNDSDKESLYNQIDQIMKIIRGEVCI